MKKEDFEDARTIIAAVMHVTLLASGTIARSISIHNPEDVADLAVKHADALMARLKNKPGLVDKDLI